MTTTPRRARRAAALTIGSLTAALLLTGCFGSPAPEPTETPKPTATVGGDGPLDTFVRVGQAADGGTFAPLEAPAGIPHGDGVEVPEKWLAAEGLQGLGETIVAQVSTGQGSAESTVLIAVDEVSLPVTGDELTSVLGSVGLGNDGSVVVQRVTVRVREIARTAGSPLEWNVTEALELLNGAGGSMTVVAVPNSAYGCNASTTPFDGHDLTTNDTVQLCFYAVGDVTGYPDVWLNGVRVNNANTSVMVLSETYQPDGIAGHDDQVEGELRDDGDDH